LALSNPSRIERRHRQIAQELDSKKGKLARRAVETTVDSPENIFACKTELYRGRNGGEGGEG